MNDGKDSKSGKSSTHSLSFIYFIPWGHLNMVNGKLLDFRIFTIDVVVVHTQKYLGNIMHTDANNTYALA